MQTIILLFSIAVALFCIAALSEHGKATDAYRRRKESLKDAVKPVRDEELNKPIKERIIAPFLQGFTRFTANVKPKSDTRSPSYLHNERLLRQAGLSITPEGYRYFRILLTGVLVGVNAFAGIILGKGFSAAALWILIGILLSALLPNYYVKARAKRRQKQMRADLPELMDMLSVCVEAGLSLDSAVVRIAEKSNDIMVEELRATIREIQYGKSRKDAFRDLAERYDIGELKTFAAAMVQAEKYGIPIKNILKAQADKLRDARKQTAQEKAMKAPVKIMIPIVIFIFPVLFIILMGPSVISIMDMVL
jgi:tight adherence protein C